MKFKDFMTALDGEIKNVYLLCGAETFFIDKAREKILTRLGVDKKTDLITFDCNTKPEISEVVSAIDSSPLFNEINVVLVKNAQFLDGRFERLENTLLDMRKTNYVIFTTKTADSRRRLFKIVSKVGDILEAEPLRPWEIGEWLNEKLSSLGKTMRGEARRFFNERLGMLSEISLWYLDNELDKVALNVAGKEITAADLRRNMLEPPEVSDFAIADAIDERNPQKALFLLKAQSRVQAKIPLVTAVLVNHVRRLLRAKFFIAQGITGSRLAEPLNMNSYIAQRLSDKARTYQEKMLEEVFIDLSEADFLLKTGRADVEVLERIIIKLCRR